MLVGLFFVTALVSVNATPVISELKITEDSGDICVEITITGINPGDNASYNITLFEDDVISDDILGNVDITLGGVSTFTDKILFRDEDIPFHFGNDYKVKILPLSSTGITLADHLAVEGSPVQIVPEAKSWMLFSVGLMISLFSLRFRHRDKMNVGKYPTKAISCIS